MNSKIKYLLWFGIFTGGFSFLVYYNMWKAQAAIKATKPSVFSIQFVENSMSSSNSISWQVEAPPDLSTPKTGIYFSENSSPSALHQYDSPEAVGYLSFTPDYSQGSFKLPDTFDVNVFADPGKKIYYRAYAKVGNMNLWTEERSFIMPKQ